MTIDSIIEQMGRLQQLHESLLALSTRKTEILKSNDTEALQDILVQERKHVQGINTVEKQRMARAAAWAESAGFAGEAPTVSEMLEAVEGQERVRLKEAYDAFILVLADLKQQEVLNAELTKQSLQFITMSLDMLQPSLTNMNYGTSSQGGEQKRSVFDSKA
ncbi:flagellar protein FlgN [Halobacillus hunanensis]|uniref:flagellar protein FlgN n=1 Tax=Halobacillus hunanensis TaxID=578214 RepID=UPI0009A7C2D8|nr:flagellar protein FlgN [Halobacillus hunanensis]